MRQLVVVSNPRLAQAFIDYMATRQILCQLGPAEQGVTIWLVNDHDFEQAERELKDFLADPLHQRYQEASWKVGEHSGAHFHYTSSWKTITELFVHRAGPVTLLMMFIASAVFVAGWLTGEQGMFDALRFADSLPGLLHQPWRLITPILLHFTLLHILFNLLWWWEFGSLIEQRCGSAKLVMLTLVAAIIPNMAQFLISGPAFGGLSGVIYALLGYLWWSGWLRPHSGLGINRAIVGFMLVWLVLGFAQLVGPATANMAHLFGLIVGCLQAVFDRFTDKDIS